VRIQPASADPVYLTGTAIIAEREKPNLPGGDRRKSERVIEWVSADMQTGHGCTRIGGFQDIGLLPSVSITIAP
jgi:hypothetical protein